MCCPAVSAVSDLITILWARLGLTTLLTRLTLSDRPVPMASALHLPTHPVCSVLMLRLEVPVPVRLRWRTTPIVLVVLSIVTREEGYVKPRLVLTVPDFTMTHVLLNVPCNIMAITGIRVPVQVQTIPVLWWTTLVRLRLELGPQLGILMRAIMGRPNVLYRCMNWVIPLDELMLRTLVSMPGRPVMTLIGPLLT